MPLENLDWICRQSKAPRKCCAECFESSFPSILNVIALALVAMYKLFPMQNFVSGLCKSFCGIPLCWKGRKTPCRVMEVWISIWWTKPFFTNASETFRPLVAFCGMNWSQKVWKREGELKPREKSDGELDMGWTALNGKPVPERWEGAREHA